MSTLERYALRNKATGKFYLGISLHEDAAEWTDEPEKVFLTEHECRKVLDFWWGNENSQRKPLLADSEDIAICQLKWKALEMRAL